MRTLDAALTKAQASGLLDPAIKITLTSGATSIEITKTRLKKLNHVEEPWRINAKETIFDNSDGYFTDLDLKGYQAVISYGLVTKAGLKYSDTSPMWVKWQTMNSVPGGLTCELTMLGIPDLMDLDEANASYLPTITDTDTVKDLLVAIAGATLDCYDHCTAYEIVWDGEDALIDSYQPQDSFRVYVGGSRLAAMKRLLSFTGCVMRFEDDGKIHVFVPTTTGTTYDYEYSLKDPDARHTFFSKAYRKALVLPNRVVIQSQPDDDPQYTGNSTSAASYALIPKSAYYQIRLASNAEATAIAEAVIANLELNSEIGSADVPMNCGAELYDYIKVTDEREGANRTGNLGSIIRRYSADLLARGDRNAYSMRFSFGDPPTVRHIKELVSEVSNATNLQRIDVKNLYAEYISAGNIDFTDITYDFIQDGVNYHGVKSAQIDASGLIFLDSIVDTGGTYKRTLAAGLDATGLVLLDEVVENEHSLVLASQVQAGKILLSAETMYASGYDPTGKEVLIHRGTTAPADTTKLWFDTTTGLMKCYSGGAWKVLEGEWYRKTGVAIDATKGIALYGGQISLKTYPTVTDYLNNTNVQCYVGSNGKIYAGAGAVSLGSDGLSVYGQYCLFYYGATLRGYIAGEVGRLLIGTTLNQELHLGVLNSSAPAYIQAKYLVIPILTNDPVSPEAGAMWFNNTTKLIKGHNGTSVKTITWS